MLYATSVTTLAPDIYTATIGNFDGVHLGHAELLRRTCDKARRTRTRSLAITFWPHPRLVVGGTAPVLLTSREERLRLLENTGVNAVLELPFTREMASWQPERFAREVLNALCVRHLVIGYDFRLGRGRAGNHEMLQALGRRYGFDVERIAALRREDGIVSSTRVRAVLASSDRACAIRLLGHALA